MSQYCDHLDVSFCEQDNFEAIFDDAQDYVGFAQAVTSTRILGYFSTVEALTEAVPNPNIGDTYGIGEEAPYSLYVYSANGWIDNGVPSGPPGRPGPQGNDGAQGPPGPAAAVTAWEVKYQASASGTTIPTGTWSENIPEVPDGQFLWTRTEVTYSDGTTTTSYSVVRGVRGADGKDGKDGSDAEVTAENIAAALGYTPAMVNPNLLDNWYFYNPVNQRGHTSGATTYNTYSIDRWKWDYSGDVGSFSLGSDGITLSPASGTTLIFRQMFENPDLLNGKKLTASVLLSTGELFSDTITRANGTSQTFFNVSGRFYVTLNKANAFQVLSTSEISIVAIKLELGSVQTLARQVNGAWVLNGIPNYGEQLARCERYQQWLPVAPSTNALGMGAAISSTSIRMAIPLATPMRAKPSIEYVVGNVSQMVLVGNGTSLVPTAVAVELNDAYMPSFIFTVENAAVSELYCLIRGQASLRCLLNANL